MGNAESAKISNNIENVKAGLEAGLERVTADAKSYTEVTTELAGKKTQALLDAIEEKMAANLAETTKRIEKEAYDVRQTIAEELSAGCEKFDEELMNVKKELAETLVAKHKDQLDKLAEVNKTLEDQIQGAKDECQE